MTEGIRLDVDNGVLTVTLDRRDVLNALDLAQWRALSSAFRRAHDDMDVRALVITGAGRAFSSGADIRGMNQGRTADEQRARLELINETVRNLLELPKPTIAAVNGVSAGVSTSLVLACDLAIAVAGASFVFSWIKLGLVADGGVSWLLTRLVGPRRAKELILRARPLSASEALAWGVVNEVVEDGQALARAQALARDLLVYSSTALRLDKALIDKSLSNTFPDQCAAESDAQAACVETDEFRRAVAAFLKK